MRRQRRKFRIVDFKFPNERLVCRQMEDWSQGRPENVGGRSNFQGPQKIK